MSCSPFLPPAAQATPSTGYISHLPQDTKPGTAAVRRTGRGRCLRCPRSRAATRVFGVVALSALGSLGLAPSRTEAHDPLLPATDTLRVSLAAPDGGEVDEGGTAAFLVTVEGSTSDGAVTVRYSVSGTAVSGDDFTALSGEVTIAEDESEATIELDALEDEILDDGETVVLELTGATGPGPVVVDGTPATVTIVDDGTVTVALAPVADTVLEGERWAAKVTMSMEVSTPVVVGWETRDGTANGGDDYKAADSTVAFAPGETSKTISVPTLEDDEAEETETFDVALKDPFDSAKGGNAGGVRLDTQPRSGFIDCSVEFGPPDPREYSIDDTVGIGTIVGDPVHPNSRTLLIDFSLTGDTAEFEIDDTGIITTRKSLASDRNITYEVTVTAIIACGDTASVGVEIEVVDVGDVNRPPYVDPTIDDMGIDSGTAATVTLSEHFHDPDEDELTYTVQSSNSIIAAASVSGEALEVRGDSVGFATITVAASDGEYSVADTFEVEVRRQTPPEVVLEIPDQSIKQGKEWTSDDLNLHFEDPEGKPLEFTAEWSDSVMLTGNVSGSTLSVTGEAEGTATVTVKAKDKGGLFVTDAFEVRVTGPNQEPVAEGTIPAQAVKEGKSVALDIDLNDYFRDDDSELTYEAESSNTGKLTVSVSGSVLTVTGETQGTVTVTVTAEDECGDTATQRFDVEALGPNQAPVAQGTIPNQTVKEGKSLTLDVDLNDYFRDDDSELTYEAESSNTGKLTVSVSGSVLTVTGETQGTVTVTVTAEDECGDTATQRFDVEALGPNQAPVAQGTIPNQTVKEGKSLTLDVDLNDYFRDDDSDLTYRAESSNTGKLTVSVSGSVLTVTGETQGTVTVTVTAEDECGETATQRFDVEVLGPNQAPEAVGTIPNQTVKEGKSLTLDVDLNDYFRDDDSELTYEAESSNTGKLTVSVSGSVLGDG